MGNQNTLQSERRQTPKARCAEHSVEMQRLMDLKVTRLIGWLKRGQQHGPVMLEIALSNACNLNCGFCWKRDIKDDDSFDARRAVTLIHEAAELGVKWVRLAGGGEPLLNPDGALAVMREAKRHGMFGTLITNATTLDKTTIRDIVAMRWNEILVSLDGATAKTNDALRGKRGAFRKSVSVLKAFAEEKHRQGTSLPMMRLQFVVTHQNYHELPAYVGLAGQLGIEIITLLPLKDLNPRISNYKVSEGNRPELENMFKAVAKQAEKTGIFLEVEPVAAYTPSAAESPSKTKSPAPSADMPDVEHGPSKLLCYEPFLSLTVQADGSLGPCCHWYGRKAITLEKGGLAKAWFSREFQELRRDMIVNRRHEYCENCLACEEGTMKNLRSSLAASWGDSIIQENPGKGNHLQRGTPGGKSLDLEKVIDLKVARLLDWLKYDRQRGPVMLELILTNACNLNCGFCWKQDIKVDESLDTRRAIKLVREAAELGVKQVRLTGGGEPFLNPKKALAVMCEVKRFGLYGSMITNATLFTRQNIRHIVSRGWDEILVSLDGAIPETHNFLRRKHGAFGKVISALRLFEEEKGRQASQFPTLKLQCVVTNKNYHELPAYLGLAKKYGIKAIDLLPLQDISTLFSSYCLDAKQRAELKTILKKTMERARQASILLRADPKLYAGPAEETPTESPPGGVSGPEIITDEPDMDAKRGRLLCYEPFLSITVQANGSIAPCCCWYNSDFYTLDRSGLVGAWYSETFKELRQRFTAGLLHENCRRCEAYRQETAKDLGNQLVALWDDPQHREIYKERVVTYDSAPGVFSGGVIPMNPSGRLLGLAVRSVEYLLFALDMLGLMLRRVIHSIESLVESLLLSLEDKLRQKVAYYQLPPFVLGKDEALSLLEGKGPVHPIATFEENFYPACYLSGAFPEGAVTTEQLRVVHGPTAGRGCRRVRFALSPGDEHGEVFVSVEKDSGDWSNFKMLNLWYQGRSEGARLTLTFTDAKGQRWFSRHSGVLTGGRWQLLRVPFSNFHCPPRSQKRKVQNLKNVSDVTFHISCSPESDECRGWVDLYEAFVSN